MTNIRQTRNIFNHFLVDDTNWKMMHNRLLLRLPVHHFSCGIFIERSSDPDCFWPRIAVSSLFYAQLSGEIRIGTYYKPLCRPVTSHTTYWLWSDPATIGDAVSVITDFALPKIKLYATVEGYAGLIDSGDRFYREPQEDRMIVQIAAGNLDAARAIWHERQLWHAGKSFPPGTRADRWRLQLAAVREPLMAGDRPALAEILHAWEAANVRGTELEPYWEPTPFPLER